MFDPISSRTRLKRQEQQETAPVRKNPAIQTRNDCAKVVGIIALPIIAALGAVTIYAYNNPKEAILWALQKYAEHL